MKLMRNSTLRKQMQKSIIIVVEDMEENAPCVLTTMESKRNSKKLSSVLQPMTLLFKSKIK